MQEHIDQELARVRALLQTERTRLALDETAPFQPAEDLGAQAGLGFKADDPEVRASVYLFESHSQMAQAAATLKAALPSEGTYMEDATNGLLLFVGYTRVDGPNDLKAQFRLSYIISAFAGDE